MKKLFLALFLVLSMSSGLNSMCRWWNDAGRNQYLSCVSQGDMTAAECCTELGGEWFDRVDSGYEEYD